MSRQAIAAVLARTDLASGERLVALSLASFAGRENRAWPGAPAASARAGLSRSRYQQARERLVARGLVAVDERATGRGRASTVTLLFADTGPWWDGDDQRRALRRGAGATARPADRSASCWRRWRRSPARTALCATSRPSGCAWRQASRTGLTAVPGRRCWRRARSSSSTASAAAGTRTCGWCAIRASSGTRSQVACHGAWRRRRARVHSSRRQRRPTPRLRLRSRRQRLAERAARIGHLRRETVRS